jgi:magnesium transporter
MNSEHSFLNRKKTDPASYVFTGRVLDEKTGIQLFRYNKDECSESVIEGPDKLEKFEEGYQYWLNVHGLSKPAQIASICQKFDIHSLAIQDILDVNQRPKYQEFESFSFLTIKTTVPDKEERNTEQISFVLGLNYLISFQERKADYFEHLRYRLREKVGLLRERTPDYLLYTLLESILDNYFKTLDKLDEQTQAFDFSNPDSDPAPSVLAQIEQYKRYVQFIKKAIVPIKEFTFSIERNKSPYIQQRHMKYFLEIRDLCLTLIDQCDSILSSLESSNNLFFSVQGQRMNQVMKTLTIVSTIFIPATFVAGIYGMNFINIPELRWHYGYFAVWFLILLIIVGMLIYFKKKKWF